MPMILTVVGTALFAKLLMMEDLKEIGQQMCSQMPPLVSKRV
ncbi:hypothetical protein NC652_002545 [Populus alba x Populus x berolinensis]|nr:hypothetical protein NC652_002545 [Populus alba x Populus x berolinensis]